MTQNQNNQKKIQKQALVQGAKNSLTTFSILTDSKYEVNWHHRLIAKKLEQIEKGEIKRLMLFLPPRHGKSKLATINFPAWYLGRNPDKEIITCSYSGDLAQKFGGETRDLIASPEYKQIFDIRLKKDEKSKAKWQTQSKGSYTSVGIGGSITGRGANCLIIDDPIKSQEEAESETYREKTWNYYRATLRTRLTPGGAIILILTRWHLDDLAGRLLKKNKEKWDIIKFPAIATEDEKYREKGEALWPKWYDLDELSDIKDDIGSYYWSSEYQQEPILVENQEFKPHWIQERSWEEVSRLETRNFLTIDPAYSKKDSSDYTGICSNFVDRQNKWNLKAQRVRVNPKELIDLIFQLQEKYQYEKIGIEKTAYYEALEPFMKDEMRKRDKFLSIEPLSHSGTKKETRIRGLIPRYESKSVFHIQNECKTLENEMFTFPKGMYDDTIDATAYQLKLAKAPIGDKAERSRILQNRKRNMNNELL